MYVEDNKLELSSLKQGDIILNTQYLGALNLNIILFQIDHNINNNTV